MTEQEGRESTTPESTSTQPAQAAATEAKDSTEKTEKPEKPQRPRRERRYSSLGDRSRCRFCREKMRHIDYKDVDVLKALCRGQGRILSRQRSGNCAYHQRQVKTAIKRARYIGLLGYTEAPPR